MRPLGFQTFDQHILDLFNAKIISEETARVFSTKTSVVGRGLDTIKAAASQIDDMGLTLESGVDDDDDDDELEFGV